MKYPRRKTVKNNRRLSKKTGGNISERQRQYISKSFIELENLNTSVLQESKGHLDDYLKTVKHDTKVQSIRDLLQTSLTKIDQARDKLQELLNTDE